VLHAADGRRDVRIAGGLGSNTCRVDSVDLSVVSGCAKIVVVDVSKAGGDDTRSLEGGGGGGLSGGTDLPIDLPVDDPTGVLGLTSGTGLQCNSMLPVCPFALSGTGADELTGTVTPLGGVGTVIGGTVAAVGENWTATGMYGCTSDGHLRVTVGQEQLDVPVDCT
jgi:hypothetical protein